MITSTSGTYVVARPASVTLSTRNASLKRASVNRAATSTSHQ